MSNKKKRAAQIQKEISKILMSDWDPIGVKEYPEAHDEYDGYVGTIYRLIADGADANKIAHHLSKIESGMMSFDTDPKKLMPVAEKLVNIDVSLE